MIKEHVKYLICTHCETEFSVESNEMKGNHIMTGKLLCKECNVEYPIIKGIPRFVEPLNYTSNFGLEWNAHSRTQYDDSSGLKISEERFLKETKWGTDLKGQILLEAGSGSGRFTKHAVETGAMVISFDYSSAVEANFNSNHQNDNLLIIQANIYEMPFHENYFDRVLCIGVIQHTPDPRKTFNCLVKMMKQGAYLCTDIYLKSFAALYTTPKYLIRKITKHMDPEKLYKRTVSYVNFMWPVTRIIRRLPLGKRLIWRLMVADYTDLLPGADDKTLKEWAILDTYDMISPAFDYPQTLKAYKRWHEQEGLLEIDIQYGYNGVEGRARKA